MDYFVERIVRVYNLATKNLFQLQSSNTYVALTCEEGDIFNMCQCGWWDWYYYRENAILFPFSKEALGRFLGVSKGKGNGIA